MEKTITIDGKDICFKSTGATPLRYKQQFGRDLFADILKMNEITKIKKIKVEDIAKIDFETFYNIAWTFAKTADKGISNPIDWLDTFEEFPMMEIIPELQDLIIKTMGAKKK